VEKEVLQARKAIKVSLEIPVQEVLPDAMAFQDPKEAQVPRVRRENLVPRVLRVLVAQMVRLVQKGKLVMQERLEKMVIKVLLDTTV